MQTWLLHLQVATCDLRVLRLNSLALALQPVPGYRFLTYFLAPSVNPALISPILPHPFLWVAFPPSAPLANHSHHPSPLHSSIPGLKLSFSTNRSYHSLPFFLLDWRHGFPGLFADTSEHIRFYSLVFHSSCSPLSVVVPCCRLIWLM